MANKNVLAICLMFLVASSVVYEAQGTFLLKMYLKRKIIRTASNFTPIACKGMLLLMNRLRGGCPATREFKEFFSLFTSYVKFISNASATSKTTDTEITSQVDGLANAMSELTAVKGRAPSNMDFRDTMLSMGKTLIEQKKKGSQPLTHQQRKVLVAAMVQWTKTIATLVKTAVDLRVGDSMDISNLGLDVDVNSIVGGESDTKSGSITYEDTTGGGSGSPSGSPTDSPSGSPTNSPSGTTTDSPSGSPTESSSGSPTDSPSESPTDSPSGSPTDSPSGTTTDSPSGTTTDSPNGSPTESPSGSPTESSSGSPTESPSGSPTDSPSGSPTDSPSGSPADSPSGSPTDSPSGTTTDSPSGSPTGTPSGSKSASGETSNKGSESAKEAASPDTNSQDSQSTTSSSSKTSAKQVEIQTSKEAISFIKGLEKKYAGTVQLDTFFEKLKTSMSATTKISNTNEEKFLSKMKNAVSSVSEAASSVSSKLGKSEEAKNRIDSSQEKLMKTFKELEDLNSKIVSENKGKTVSSTQQAELKETLSKWEQVTNQFVEAATSSSSSDKSQSKSQSSQSQQSQQSQEGSTKKAETS